MTIKELFQAQIEADNLEPVMKGGLDDKYIAFLDKLVSIDYNLATECEDIQSDLLHLFRLKAYEQGFKDARNLLMSNQ